jgi:hypothetical protein
MRVRLRVVGGGLALAVVGTCFLAGELRAQECTFHPVSPPLTDLGAAEYYRLTGRTGSPPSTWTFERQPGVTGGLYPGGTNVRPAAHEAAGIALASAIQPLDASGAPSADGTIGFASIGMSNTVHGFGAFMSRVRNDPAVSGRVTLVNGAAGGGVVESWTDTSNAAQYQRYWDWFDAKLASARLTHAQIQVVWAEVTSVTLNNAGFPAGAQTLSGRILLMMRELRSRLPNVRIVYLSTRARAFNYFAGEPVGFEQGFAVKWLIERQIAGDPELNYDPAAGPAHVPYLSWGSYHWIDGPTPRLQDGRTWPLSYTDRDCLHPSAEGYAAIADMLLQFLKTDTTATPWFLGVAVPPPPPPPPDVTPPAISGVSTSNVAHASATVTWTTNEPATGLVEFLDVCPSSGCLSEQATPLGTIHTVAVTGLAPETTYRYRVRSADAAGNGAVSAEYSFVTAAVPPPPPPGGEAVSSWGFSTAVVTDDVNGCTGCANVGAVWTPGGIVPGAFQFNGSTYLNLGTFPHLNGRSQFTCSIWVKPAFDAASTTFAHVFSDGGNVVLWHLDGSRPWRANVRTTGGNVRVDAPALSWAPGTWHQLAITFGEGVVRLYWDGALVGSAAGGAAVAADSGSTYLGTSPVRTLGFNGDLDELRVYDRALSDAEILASYLEPSR